VTVGPAFSPPPPPIYGPAAARHGGAQGVELVGESITLLDEGSAALEAAWDNMHASDAQLRTVASQGGRQLVIGGRRREAIDVNRVQAKRMRCSSFTRENARRQRETVKWVIEWLSASK